MKTSSGLLLVLASVALLPSPRVRAATPKPDIVLIMADDLGFSDLGCYGGEIPTPHLDQLARRGLRFTNFSNTSRCCPSRASLLTGLYQHQAGMGAMNHPGKGPGYRGQLRAETPTLPERLKPAGYATAMVGKWHLTHSKTIDAGPNGSWPFERGFDHYFGSMEGAKNYFQPKWLFRNRTEVKEFPAEFFYTDAMADEAARFIHGRRADQPLFLYAAFYAPHFPLQAPAEMIARFRGAYREGWDVLRERRHARQLRLGVIPPGTKLSPRPDNVPAWDSLSAAQRDALDLRMAVYAAQVHLLDRGVGRIVEALRDSGRLDNTLLIFLSDNGGTDSGGPFGGGALARVGRPDADLHTTYGAGWANLSNTPYRFCKSNTHEGGVMSPLILHWPDRFGRERRGRNDAAHITDIAATCLAAAGIRAESLEGVDLFADRATGTRPFFYEHLNSRAVRDGRWKLVNHGKSDRWELYDLMDDRTELRDLAGERPDQVRHLAGLWSEWARRCHVRGPAPAPRSVKLEGVVVDDADAELQGEWGTSANLKGFTGTGYRYADADSGATATFTLTTKETGAHEVQLAYRAHDKRGTTVPVLIRSPQRSGQHTVNMRVRPDLPGGFISLTTVELQAGQRVVVQLGSNGANGRVCADAVRLLKTRD